jgi:hypothetical protein
LARGEGGRACIGRFGKDNRRTGKRALKFSAKEVRGKDLGDGESVNVRRAGRGFEVVNWGFEYIVKGN